MRRGTFNYIITTLIEKTMKLEKHRSDETKYKIRWQK